MHPFAALVAEVVIHCEGDQDPIEHAERGILGDGEQEMAVGTLSVDCANMNTDMHTHTLADMCTGLDI